MPELINHIDVEIKGVRSARISAHACRREGGFTTYRLGITRDSWPSISELDIPKKDIPVVARNLAREVFKTCEYHEPEKGIPLTYQIRQYSAKDGLVFDSGVLEIIPGLIPAA